MNGATFAYFSVTSESERTTTITAGTPNVGTVYLDKSGTYSMTLTEDDMKEANTGKYYVPSSGSTGVKDTEQELTFAVATVTGGAESKDYTCTANLSVEVDPTVQGYLEANEAMIAFKGDGVTGDNIGTSSYGTEQD